MSEFNFKILFLDDEGYRHKHIRRQTKGQNVDILHAWDAQKAIDILGRQSFDLIMLDHDLCEGTDGIEMSGMDVCKAIVGMKDRHKKAIFIVHSLNPVGAGNMNKHLSRAGFTVHEIPHAWKMLEFPNGRLVINACKTKEPTLSDHGEPYHLHDASDDTPA